MEDFNHPACAISGRSGVILSILDFHRFYKYAILKVSVDICKL